MEQQRAYVSLDGLERLQKELREMAGQLRDIHRKAGEVLAATHEKWKDVQYDKFSESFGETKARIEEASKEMDSLAEEWIQERIDILKRTNGISL